MATEEQHAAVVKQALADAGAAPYDLDELPAQDEALPEYYTEVLVERRFSPTTRLSARPVTIGWRISTRAVAKTVSNAREMRARQHAALDGVHLSVDGVLSAPVLHETSEPIAEDERWYSGATTWTYTL